MLCPRRCATVAAGDVYCRGMRGSGRPQASKSSTHALHSLYRRLRKEGEDRLTLERALSTRPLEKNIQLGLRLLHYHTRLVNIDREAREVAFWRIVRQLRLAAARRYFAWRIFSLRLRLRSTAAISDALVYFLFLTVCFMLYQMYRVCRIGVTRAEERYMTLAIPIKQTFEALEDAQERRKSLRREMEKDVLQQR
ncbi:hypothetical protein C3747_74g65 [Trypanosoma cruzi]|uniref:Transmembrane protein n=2 Tax=Trypanosoma cruzi TaxID=5693 RepID=Q4DRP4_TRYCC|nr:hypothetical protein, conserved [Trypanosoma cruzi]EAN95178.1 hypothetical protein, conserved [Trypanosoma cruzi]PWV09836.1 hypothetical protein C3747_74g65 [Trypanosoma cruzi]|eukprot:XP_817029.1 hypothetical protein [Trypanosoma cruzi strain CL Brener]